MVFIEHRGSGRVPGSDVSKMESRWDSAWKQIDINKLQAELHENENWSVIKKYIAVPGPILEAGCGLAKWVKFFQDQGFDSYGMDFSKSAIETSLKRWPDLKLVCGDLRKMDFGDGFFKGIVSLGAIEHDEDGPEKILREFSRVLASDGILYCTVPCFNYTKRMGVLAIQDGIVCNKTIRKLTGRNDDAKFFEYVWTPEEYRKILESAGFNVLDLIPMSPSSNLWGTPGSFKRKLMTKIHKKIPWAAAHMMAGVCKKR
jgi:SAM-dependent methyltransferase